MCISLATIYYINPGSLYFTQPLFFRPGHVCGVEYHACGVVARFSNFPWAGAWQHTGAWARQRSLVSFHVTVATIIWTEPVKYWRKACLLACLDHTVLLQIMAMSLTLRSIIVLADDARWKRRLTANNTSPQNLELSATVCLRHPLVSL